MPPNEDRKLVLESLSQGIDVINEEAVGFYKQNCMVCFDSQGHKTGVKLAVHHSDSRQSFQVCWSGEVSEQLKKNYADLTRATDNAACAIALLLIRELTEFQAVEQASIGTTVDYFLGLKDQPQDDLLIFNHKARLEVSGILKEKPNNTVSQKVRKKIKRLKSGLPAFIVVVEFCKPWSQMENHE